MPVQRHAHFPGPRKYFRIFDRGLILEDIRADGGVALDHVQRLAMEIAGTIKPGLIVKARHIDHQRVALPMAVRRSHPAIHRSFPRLAQIDGPNSARVLIGDHDGVRALENLKGIGHVSRSRHARQIAFQFRIGSPAIGKIFLLFRAGCRQIRQRVALDDSNSGRHRADGAQGGWSRTWPVRLYIPIGLVESLPNPVQVGLAVDCTQPAVGRRLSSGRDSKQKSQRDGCRGNQEDSGSHMKEALLRR